MVNDNSLPLVKSLSCLVASLLFLLTAGMAWAQNPVPLINEPLVPDTVMPGSAGFTLVVNGTGFAKGAVVNWNGSARATSFVSSSQLKAAVLSSDIAKAGTASVRVLNPSPGGGGSNAVFFPVARPTTLVFTESTFSTSPGECAPYPALCAQRRSQPAGSALYRPKLFQYRMQKLLAGSTRASSLKT
jgi:hypothetical protein